MSYAAQGQAAQTSAPREPSLNERLNRVSERLQTQCDRIESVLCRVNGTPQAAQGHGADKPAQITPTLPLATIVEHLEAVQARLTDLSAGIERIA